MIYACADCTQVVYLYYHAYQFGMGPFGSPCSRIISELSLETVASVLAHLPIHRINWWSPPAVLDLILLLSILLVLKNIRSLLLVVEGQIGKRHFSDLQWLLLSFCSRLFATPRSCSFIVLIVGLNLSRLSKSGFWSPRMHSLFFCAAGSPGWSAYLYFLKILDGRMRLSCPLLRSSSCRRSDVSRLRTFTALFSTIFFYFARLIYFHPSNVSLLSNRRSTFSGLLRSPNQHFISFSIGLSEVFGCLVKKKSMYPFQGLLPASFLVFSGSWHSSSSISSWPCWSYLLAVCLLPYSFDSFIGNDGSFLVSYRLFLFLWWCFLRIPALSSISQYSCPFFGRNSSWNFILLFSSSSSSSFGEQSQYSWI